MDIPNIINLLSLLERIDPLFLRLTNVKKYEFDEQMSPEVHENI